MRILVTGANGYLGRGVVKQLLDDGMDVIAVDMEDRFVDKRALFKKGDIFSTECPYHFFECPDALLHMAWKNGFVHNAVSHIEDFPKHYRFLEKMILAGIPRIAVMGSMHEIGFFEGAIRDSTPANPQSLYGISKNALRQAIGLLAGQNKTVFQWMRGFYIVGNSEYGCSVFSKIAKAEKAGDQYFPFTSGQNQWDFIDYKDFCIQAAAVVEQDMYSGIINICSGYPQKLADRAERFLKENGYQIKLAYGTFPDRPYDSKAVWGDDTVIRKILEDR